MNPTATSSVSIGAATKPVSQSQPVPPPAPRNVTSNPPAPVLPGPKPAQALPTKASSAQGQTLPPSTQSQHRSIRFEMDAPGARSVSVVGTFNNWAPGASPLVLQGGTKWGREISLASGRHEYRFVVDGKWTDDPKAKTYAPNPHGGRNAVLTV